METSSTSFLVLCMSKLNRLKQIMSEQAQWLQYELRLDEDMSDFLETVSYRLARGQRRIIKKLSIASPDPAFF